MTLEHTCHVLIPAPEAIKPQPQSHKCQTLTCLFLKLFEFKITRESRLIFRFLLLYLLQSNKSFPTFWETPVVLRARCHRGRAEKASLSHSICGGAQAQVLGQTQEALVSLCSALLFLRRIHHDSAENCCSNDFLIIFPLSSSLVANLST